MSDYSNMDTKDLINLLDGDTAKVATKIKDLDCSGCGTPGMVTSNSQALFRCDPPLEGHEFVVASCACIMGEPETYLFPSDSEGTISSWGELDGSIKGVLDYAAALGSAGYRVANTP